MSLEDNQFDAAYSIEATCHAPDKVGVYKEILRVLKPGARYATYEWIMTKNFDPQSEEQVKLKKGIEKGNGLPDLETEAQIVDHMKEAGFEVLEVTDLANRSDKKWPWYQTLGGSFSLSGFKMTRVGRYLTNRFCAVLEKIHIAPKGTTEVSNLLMATADDLVAAGKQEIFSPVLIITARKPKSSK